MIEAFAVSKPFKKYSPSIIEALQLLIFQFLKALNY